MQVIHARSGVPHEIMGLMQGKVMDNTLVIMDSFALPVQGTETRVNAANEANEYMVEYIQGSEKVCSLLLYSRVMKLIWYCGPVGWKIGECSRVVSFTPRLWVLAIWDRCQHPAHEPAVPRSIRSSRCKPYPSLSLIRALIHLLRSTQTAPSQLAKSTLAPSAHTHPPTPHPLHLPPNTSLSP